MAGILYLVATPIGNLEDITYRAVRTLKEVDLIACEDTRQTMKLLNHYGVRKPILSYHQHNEITRTAELVAKLQSGLTVALVSDAGTPLVSDPGYRLVTAAIAAGVVVTPIPGPSAMLAALAASGLPTDSFRFLGFLPPKSTQRQRILESLKNETATMILYESPHRVLDTLKDIEAILGASPVVLGRELTKLHEEFLRGTALELSTLLRERPSIKGEITLVVGKPEAAALEEAGIAQAVEAATSGGMSRMDAIKHVAHTHRLPKREVYRRVQEQRP